MNVPRYLKRILNKKLAYQDFILQHYGKAVFLEPTELLELQRECNPEYYATVRLVFSEIIRLEREEACVAYVLVPSSPGSKFCSNGVRYGGDSAYYSLPPLPAELFTNLTDPAVLEG